MGVFDAVASIFTTGQTNKANLQAVRETNEANANLWREQTAYNAPEQQMKRLEAAGLNPNMVYGTMGESKASNPPSMEAPHFDRPDISGLDDTLSKYQQVVNLQEQNKQVRLRTDIMKSQAKREAAAAEYTDYETQELKKSGALKSDQGNLRLVERGTGFVSDRVQSFIRWMENENSRHYEEDKARQEAEK